MRFVLLVFVAALATCLAVDDSDNPPWWKTAVLYQVYPRSFKDSDGDGIGDLKGIIDKADYFQEISVDGIWLSPIYKSPMADMGYDISNFTDIDPIFGTMADFDTLVTTLKKIGIKLLMDLVPNHSSDQHPWFQASKDPNHPLYEDYKDFYVWRDPSGWNGTTPLLPNNWISVFDGPMWSWSEERQQFYLHQFKPQQPDFNYRNPKVVGNMTEVLKFWMDRGVSGFRVDAGAYVFENDQFEDQPPVPGTSGDTYPNQMHIYTVDQPESFDLIKNWTKYVRTRGLQDGVDRTLLLEVYDTIPIEMKFYDTDYGGMTMPFNFDLLFVDQETRAASLKNTIMTWMDALPQGLVTTWVTGNHDQSRVTNKCGPEMTDAMNLLTGVLPGNKVVYYGEEIGMTDTYIRADQTLDHSRYHRDVCRTPMQWNDSLNAGFSTNSSTWLPVNPNYWWLNVAAQRSAQSSHLQVFQAMAKARKDPVLQRGDLTILTPDNDTLVVVRYYDDSYFTLLINVGSETQSFTSQNLLIPNKLDMDMSVVIGSVNFDLKPGTTLRQRSISLPLRPKAAVLLRSLNSSSSSSSAAFTLHHCTLFLSTLLLLIHIHHHL